MSNRNRAEQLIAKLDEITQELKELVNESVPQAASRISDIRTEMGFEKGGYYGHRTLEELLDDLGAFDDQPDDEEDEE